MLICAGREHFPRLTWTSSELVAATYALNSSQLRTKSNAVATSQLHLWLWLRLFNFLRSSVTCPTGVQQASPASQWSAPAADPHVRLHVQQTGSTPSCVHALPPSPLDRSMCHVSDFPLHIPPEQTSGFHKNVHLAKDCPKRCQSTTMLLCSNSTAVRPAQSSQPAHGPGNTLQCINRTSCLVYILECTGTAGSVASCQVCMCLALSLGMRSHSPSKLQCSTFGCVILTSASCILPGFDYG